MYAYRKFITAALGTALFTLVAATTDDVLSRAEIAQLVLAVLGTFSVYVLPNAPGYSAIKSLVMAASAGVGLLAGWLTTGEEITTSMWINLVLVVGTALGVFVAPNGPEPAT